MTERQPTRRQTRRRSDESPQPRREVSIAGQLRAIERRGGDGEIALPGGVTLAVSSLDKLFFPAAGVTKGDLLRYYARVAPVLLPEIDARPLALKRYPNGVTGPSFFQHHPGASPAAATRVAPVPVEAGGTEPRYVGGDLATLLETVQLGTIAVNPWHSRLGTLDSPDYCVLDLDPGPDAPFARVVQLALVIRDELETLALRSAVKTSGSRGVHILIPLPPHTRYDASAALAERIATRVARAHPAEATVERALGDRAPGQVYIDHMQNARGKTLASVFSARARPHATVSTPLSWRRLARPGFDPASYTVATVPRQLARLAARWRASIETPSTPGAVRSALRAGR